MFLNEGWGQYAVNFDGPSDATSGSSYGFTNHNLNGITWTGVQVIIPTTPLADDWFLGTRSLRSRGYGTSSFEMTQNKTTGAGTISFDFRSYGAETQVAHRVEYSTNDGSSWSQAGSDFTGTGTVQSFSATLNLSGSIRFRIRTVSSTGTSNRRLNIDDIVITDYVAASCSAPTTQASDITFGNVTANSMDVNWTNGNGAGRVVIMNTANSFTAPADGDNPTANTVYGSGQQVIFNGTGSGPVSVSGLSSSTTYWFRVYEFCNPDRTYITATATDNPLSQDTNTPAGDTDSDIIENSGFTYNSNIAYINSVNAGLLTNANSVELAQFTIRDGGAGTDADAFSTTLTNLTLSVSNHNNLNRIGIFDGSTNVAEAASSASLSFSGLSLVAADNSTKTFSIRASFNSTVTDNEQIQLTITSATAQAGASLFAAADAGGASSSTTVDRNRIEVTATQLAFVQQPTNTNINEAMSPAVTVEATDVNNNRDLDYTSTINITSTGTLTGSPVGVAAVAGLATFSTLTHTAAGIGLTLTAASGALTDATSGTFDVVALQFINFDTDANWNLSAGSGYQTGFIYTENNWTFTGGPALRNGTAAQDGFPGAFGTYSWRLRDAAYNWTATYTAALVSGQKIKSVGFDVRRWDGSPNPNAIVEFSVNGGSSYTTATSFGSSGTIDNAGLSNSSNWSTFSHAVNTPAGLAVNQFVLRVSSSGGGERIMIDNFSYEFETVPPTITLSSPLQVSADNVAAGATNVVLSHFQAAVSDAGAELESLDFTSTGTYQAADLSGDFKLHYATSNSFGAASVIGNVSAAAPGSFSFTSLAQNISKDSTGYFWITADIDIAAIAGRTITISANPTLNFSSGTPTGTIAQGGAQTIQVLAATVVLSSPNPSIALASLSQGGVNQVIGRFDLAVSTANAQVTSLEIDLAGTFDQNDVSNLTLWHSTTNTFDANTDDLLQTISMAGSAGTKIFSLFSQTILAGNTGYFFITVDVSCVANTSNTIRAEGIGTANLIFSTSVNASGTSNASGLHNIQDASPENVSALNLIGLNAQIEVSWNNPSGCFDDVIVVVSTSSNSGTPSGTSYTNDLDFTGSGAALGNGKVVYQGSNSPQIVSGLANGTSYFVKVFSRKGNTWSSGIELSASPLVPVFGWAISREDSLQIIDFDNTVEHVNNGQFAGSGFSPNPTTGQLNSNAWSTSGMSDGASGFGESKTSGDLARGSSTGSVSTGGFYAFEISTGNFAFGFQPGSSDFAPGNFKLRSTNALNKQIDSLAFSFKAYVLNDQGRSTNFRFSYSTDSSIFVSVPFLDVVSEEASNANGWELHELSTVLRNLNLSSGSRIFFRWTSEDVGGGGSRDELAIDDISIIANPVNTRFSIDNNFKIAKLKAISELSADVNVSDSLVLEAKLFTGIHKIVLGENAFLSELENNTIEGIVETTRNVSKNANNTFGGIGIQINPLDTSMGTTKITRVTGSRLSGYSGATSLLRYYQVEPSTNDALNASVVFGFAPGDLIDNDDNAVESDDLGLFKRPIGGGAEDWVQLTGANIDAANNRITVNGVKEFSEIALADAVNTPLPVDLLYFKGISSENSNVLEWATLSESNNAYFELEKSLDGKRFDRISVVSGAGNSRVLTNYAYTDFNPGVQTYYRLKQVDFDGKYNYSNVLSLYQEFQVEKDVPEIFRSGNFLIIRNNACYNSTLMKLEIYDLHGRTIESMQLVSSQHAIFQPNISAEGIYIVHISYDKHSFVKKIKW